MLADVKSTAAVPFALSPWSLVVAAAFEELRGREHGTLAAANRCSAKPWTGWQVPLLGL